MSGFTNVLVATDGSPSSQRAVERGVEFAAVAGGHVTFLHVVPPIAWRTTRLGSTPRTLRRRAADDPILAEAEHVAETRGVESSAECVAGDEVASILAISEDIGADVLVLGRGRHRLKTRSVSKSVVRRAKCPVFVAHAPAA